VQNLRLPVIAALPWRFRDTRLVFDLDTKTPADKLDSLIKLTEAMRGLPAPAHAPQTSRYRLGPHRKRRDGGDGLPARPSCLPPFD
jgi:hypothetical protein